MFKCAEENDFFANDVELPVSDRPSPSIRIGLTDADIEGQWISFDGKPAPYTNWHIIRGMPNKGTSGNYVKLG